jgi:hypothetical protein
VNGSNELLDDRPVLSLVIRDRVLIIEQVILLGIALDMLTVTASRINGTKGQ